MAEGARPALGLSIGATNLAGVTADLAVIRKPVLTLFRNRPPEVGLPGENPRLDEPGLVINAFVDRVGDPVGIVAADGSAHRSEALVTDGLRALAYAATGGRPLPENVGVTYPAHWSSKSVDILGAALSRVSDWSNRTRPLLLIPDAAAALFAVRADPGLPARGTVAVCDFGGSGTSITLMDAGDYQAVAPTVRHTDFSGDMIDQALLTAVLDNMPTGSFDPSGASPIGPLNRLRTGCRIAKEQLSASTVTTLTDGRPGMRGDIRVTRNELEDAIHELLNNFVAVLDEALRRNGIRDLVAVVSVGGGANIPAVTTTLSGHLRVPVVTTPRPQLTAAIGGALRAAGGPGDNSATSPNPAAPVTATALATLARAAQVQPGGTATAGGPVMSMMPALAWSVADNHARTMPAGTGEYPKSGGWGYTSGRPELKFDEPARPHSQPKKPVRPWYRQPAVAIISAAVAILLVGTALAIELNSGHKPTATPSPGVSTTPASPAPPANAGSSQPPPPNTGQPATSTQQAPPPPSAADINPPPATDTPIPPATQQGTVDAPAPAAPPPARPAPRVPPILRIPAIPSIPPIPGINAPIPDLGGIPNLVARLFPAATR